MGAGLTTVTDDVQGPLAGAGVYLGNPIQYEGSQIRKEEGFVADLGYINSDQNGTLDVYQGTIAQVNAITNTSPAAGTGDGQMKLNTFAFVGSATNVGFAFTVPLVGQAIRLRYTNGAVAQATFSLHSKLVQ